MLGILWELMLDRGQHLIPADLKQEPQPLYRSLRSHSKGSALVSGLEEAHRSRDNNIIKVYCFHAGDGIKDAPPK